MACYVYFLHSEKSNKFYVGISNDVDDRLKRHNKGKSLSTKHAIPWKLLHVIACENKSVAMVLERKIKKRGISRFLSDKYYAWFIASRFKAGRSLRSNLAIPKLLLKRQLREKLLFYFPKILVDCKIQQKDFLLLQELFICMCLKSSCKLKRTSRSLP